MLLIKLKALLKLSDKDLNKIFDIKVDELPTDVKKLLQENISLVYKSIIRNANILSNFITNSLKAIILDNRFYNKDQLIQYINAHADKFVEWYFTTCFIKTNDTMRICKKLNITDTQENRRKIVHWIINNIDRQQYLKIIINSVISICNKLFLEFIDDPRKFINFNDNTSNKNIVYSTVTIENFPSIHSKYILVVNDEVIYDNNLGTLLNNYCQKNNITRQELNKINAFAWGSVFNNVVLLNICNNDLDKIKNTLINNGFKKVYISQFTNWTWNQYKRIAKRLNVKLLYKI